MTPNGEIIDQLHAAVARADARTTEEAQIAARIAMRTQGVIRIVLFVLAIVAIVVLYLIQDLARGMLQMSENMVAMDADLAEVRHDMRTITHSIGEMSGQIRSLPAMREQMVRMRRDMGDMSGSIRSIDNELAAMDLHVSRIAVGVGEMAWRFEWLAGATRGMGHSVNQMSQPMRTFDPFGFMGR